MHPVFLEIILFSLLVSSLAAIWMIKKKQINGQEFWQSFL
ncbi:hypothetical protein Plano_1514 [Planococcus sp. PAMC 21323]|nr:hypothetical protein Plano_1514 [Planococcus sp. PAMC 21323]